MSDDQELRAAAAVAAAVLALRRLRDLTEALADLEQLALGSLIGVSAAVLGLGDALGEHHSAAVEAAAISMRAVERLARDAEGALAVVAPHVEAAQVLEAIAERDRGGRVQ